MAEVSFAQINSAIAERDSARSRVAELETEIDSMAEVAFAQINSAIAERDAQIIHGHRPAVRNSVARLPELLRLPQPLKTKSASRLATPVCSRVAVLF